MTAARGRTRSTRLQPETFRAATSAPGSASPGHRPHQASGGPLWPRVRRRIGTRYAARVIPWIVVALVVVPLVVIAFVATRRRKVAGEHPASEDAEARARTEQEFAEAEAYEATWREKDVERYHQERLP